MARNPDRARSRSWCLAITSAPDQTPDSREIMARGLLATFQSAVPMTWRAVANKYPAGVAAARRPRRSYGKHFAFAEPGLRGRRDHAPGFSVASRLRARTWLPARARPDSWCVRPGPPVRYSYEGNGPIERATTTPREVRIPLTSQRVERYPSRRGGFTGGWLRKARARRW